MEHLPEGTDPRSGYCSSDGIYYSKRPPVWIPPTRNFDLVSFVFAPQFGDRVAMVDAPTGRSLTYAQLERNVRVVAAGLYKNLGVRQYDVVMLLSPNSIEFAVVFFAVMSLGAVLTTVNSVNTTGEIQKQMNDAGIMSSLLPSLRCRGYCFVASTPAGSHSLLHECDLAVIFPVHQETS